MMTEEQVKELRELRSCFEAWLHTLGDQKIPIPSYDGEEDAYLTGEIRGFAKKALSYCYSAELEIGKVLCLLDELIEEESGKNGKPQT